jgi:hypothetical protein
VLNLKDGEALLEMATESRLIEIGVKELGIRIKLMKRIRQLTKQGTSGTPHCNEP